MHRQPHCHPAPRTVLTAFAVTLLAAGLEFAGAWRGGSLFLAADAFHLLAHIGIFGVLLIPSARGQPRGRIDPGAHARVEDATTIAVLALVLLIAAGITTVSIRELSAIPRELPNPAFFLLALAGLLANVATAYLFKDPARTHWSFRAALAHELSDGALTIAGLIGALAIKVLGWPWIDPGLSLGIGLWLAGWSVRLFRRRVRLGSRAWTMENGSAGHGHAPTVEQGIEGLPLVSSSARSEDPASRAQDLGHSPPR